MWLLLAAGTAIRVPLAFTTLGVRFDIDSYRLVAHFLAVDPLHLYGTVNAFAIGGVHIFRWPYLPGFFPWILISRRISDLSGLPFQGFLKLPAMAADLAIAWLVHEALARRGASLRVRLGAVALVMFGPAFVLTSAYHGQIDAVAILPALAGVLLWKRARARRALWCGLLIGAGALLKTVPLLLVLALLPTARSMRERVTLVAASLLIPATSIVPFVVADPAGVGLLRQYSGVPGMGGLTLLVQPGLARAWVAPGQPLDPGSTAIWLVNHGSTITVAAVLAVSLWLFRNQADAVDGSILILLTVYVSGAGFAFQYLVWVLPFLLVAGRLGMTLAIQAIAVVPAVLFYSQLEVGGAAAAFATLMIGLWACFLLALVRWGSRPGEVRHEVAAV